MKDSVIAAALKATPNTIEQVEAIHLSLADQKCFAKAQLSPPQSTPALERAFSRRKKLIRAD